MNPHPSCSRCSFSTAIWGFLLGFSGRGDPLVVTFPPEGRSAPPRWPGSPPCTPPLSPAGHQAVPGGDQQVDGPVQCVPALLERGRQVPHGPQVRRPAGHRALPLLPGTCGSCAPCTAVTRLENPSQPCKVPEGMCLVVLCLLLMLWGGVRVGSPRGVRARGPQDVSVGTSPTWFLGRCPSPHRGFP